MAEEVCELELSRRESEKGLGVGHARTQTSLATTTLLPRRASPFHLTPTSIFTCPESRPTRFEEHAYYILTLQDSYPSAKTSARRKTNSGGSENALRAAAGTAVDTMAAFLSPVSSADGLTASLCNTFWVPNGLETLS